MKELVKDLNKRLSIDLYGSPEDVEMLEQFSKEIGVNIPQDYKEIIKKASDIVISVDNDIVIRIWGAEWCVNLNEAYSIPEFSPNSLAIADNGGGKCLIYLEGIKGNGLYYTGFGDLDAETAIYLAPTLTDLLLKGEGIQSLLDNY